GVPSAATTATAGGERGDRYHRRPGEEGHGSAASHARSFNRGFRVLPQSPTHGRVCRRPGSGSSIRDSRGSPRARLLPAEAPRHALTGSDASSTLRPLAVSETSMLPRVAFEYGHT